MGDCLSSMGVLVDDLRHDFNGVLCRLRSRSSTEYRRILDASSKETFFLFMVKEFGEELFECE